jgi:hypothetical protein
MGGFGGGGGGEELDAHAAEAQHDELARGAGVEYPGAFEAEVPGVKTLLRARIDAVKGDMVQCVHLSRSSCFGMLLFRNAPVSGCSCSGMLLFWDAPESQLRWKDSGRSWWSSKSILMNAPRTVQWFLPASAGFPLPPASAGGNKVLLLCGV